MHTLVRKMAPLTIPPPKSLTFSHERNTWLASSNNVWVIVTPEAAKGYMDAGWRLLDDLEDGKQEPVMDDTEWEEVFNNQGWQDDGGNCHEC